MKNFITFIGVILLALWILTFFMYPSDMPVHIILGIAILVAVFGVVKMKQIGKV